jgi:uncharacterized protein with von Willebrand factor type A (vWA) domain
LLVDFFLMLRSAGIPVSVTEYLTLLDALSRRVAGYSVDDFYYLARASLVKDERHFDRFDRVFGAHFQGMQELFDEVVGEIPEEWLRLAGMGNLSEEEKQQIEALGGWEKLMETLRERLAEQRERHQGGSKWVGTGGTSPFGAYGYNPEGIRIGQKGSRNRRAVKVWDRREFKNLDDSVEIGTRTRIWTTAWRSARATSRSRYGVCASLPAVAPPRSWTSTIQSAPPHEMQGCST